MDSEKFFQNSGLYIAYSVKNKEGKFTPVVSRERAVEFAKLKLEELLTEIDRLKQKGLDINTSDLRDQFLN